MPKQPGNAKKTAAAKTPKPKLSQPVDSVAFFDAQGNLNVSALSQGAIVLRLDPNLRDVTLTWVPDDGTQPPARKHITHPAVPAPGAAAEPFEACVQNKTIGDTSTETLMSAIAGCLGELLKP